MHCDNAGTLESKYEALGYTIEYYRCQVSGRLTNVIYKFNGEVIDLSYDLDDGLIKMTPNDQMKILQYEVRRLRNIIDVLKAHILGDPKEL